MFPPDANSTWDPKLSWQPIPVHTVPEVDDEILAMKKECKLYTKISEQYKQSKSYKKNLSQYQGLME